MSRVRFGRGQATVLLDKLSLSFVMDYAPAVNSTENKDKQIRHNKDYTLRTVEYCKEASVDTRKVVIKEEYSKEAKDQGKEAEDSRN